LSSKKTSVFIEAIKMMIHYPLKRGRALFFLPLLVSLLSLLPLAAGSGARGGPLLFQVHFMNPLRGLSLPEAGAILRGDTGPLAKAAGLPGGFTLYADKNIAPDLAREYPQMRFTECDAVTAPPESDRGAVLISDLRGMAPSMKILPVEGCYPWGAMGDDYGLKKDAPYPLLKDWATPWEPSKHVTVAQTGVTAMTRAFTTEVRRHGDILRPVRAVRHITAEADLAVTSNEVSFIEKCPTPLPDRMAFCSPCDFLDILKYAGFDVIELTGNHNNDYGREAGLDTINRYKKEGMRYFGGGIDINEAGCVCYVKSGDTTFAFVGFNEYGPREAWATERGSGAARLTLQGFRSGIEEAVRKADVVIVTVQWGNEDDPVAAPRQVEYFHMAADMGAHIMVSSSAHRAMGQEFYRGKFISYGLGNFLFDQMQTVNHRRGLIARYHIYNRRHIQTELIPYLLYNHSEPRIVSGREARELFDYVYRYSRGPVFH
jgi:hypothetical protein